MESEFHIEICYALKEKQYSYKLKVPEGTTILDAISKSGVLDDCPEILLEQSRVGIFSEFRSLQDRVNDGDRIEIYRELKIDPKQLRRERANRKK